MTRLLEMESRTGDAMYPRQDFDCDYDGVGSSCTPYPPVSRVKTMVVPIGRRSIVMWRIIPKVFIFIVYSFSIMRRILE